jgi:large repetitive protein
MPSRAARTATIAASVPVMATDAAGNLYFADYDNAAVYKVTPADQLSVFAGTGTAGAPTPGPATASRMRDPSAVAFDRAGNAFITDVQQHEVYKVDTNGDLSIFAGTGTNGAPVAGPATASPLKQPYGIAADPDGIVYVADSNTYTIDKIDTNGDLSVITGTGSDGAPTYDSPAASSAVHSPIGVTADLGDVVYITDDVNVDRIGVPTPLAPTHLHVTAGDNSAVVSFTVPARSGTSAITGYEVSTDGGATWHPLATTGSGSTRTATLTDLSNGTRYPLQVRAVNDSGSGAASSTADVTPEAAGGLPATGFPTAEFALTGAVLVGIGLVLRLGLYRLIRQR